jgi:nitrate/nitrite transporter NarK
LIGYALAHQLTDAQLDKWGWRVAFLLGAVIVPFGLILRSRLIETHEPVPAPSGADRVRHDYRRVAIVAFFLLVSGTMVTYVMNNLTTYASTTLGMSTSASFGATVSQGLTGMVFALVGGALSDRLGRRAVMFWPRLILLLAIFPAFWVLGQLRTAGALFGATAVMSCFAALAMGASFASITESLPKAVRSGVLAIVYAVAISVFGGITPFAVTGLTHLTGNPMTPAFYMMGAVVIGLTASLLMPESAPVKTGSTD